MQTFFADVEPKFSPVPDDGMILADQFLNAAKQMIPFIGKLTITGSVTAAHIEKLTWEDYMHMVFSIVIPLNDKILDNTKGVFKIYHEGVLGWGGSKDFEGRGYQTCS